MKLKPTHGKTFSQVLDDARRAVAVVPGLTYGFTEAGPFGQKPLQYSVRGPEMDELDRISRELVRAMGKIPGLVDVETSLEKSKPELRVEFDRERAGDLGLNVAPGRDDAARRGHRARSRRRSRTRPATATTCACGCAPTSAATRTTCSALRGADRQGRRPRRQDPRPAQRGGDGAAGHRPLDDPPQGPAARGAHLGHELAAAAWARSRATSSGRRRSSSCPRATTSCRAATPRSSRPCSRTCSRPSPSRSSSST